MPHEYTELCRMCPRSFLFAVVANVGPGGASRSLAVAYRQGNDYIKETHLERVDHFVADILALIEILSDPANRAPLEAERALAKDCYWRSLGGHEAPLNPRPNVPDSVQPPYLPWKEEEEEEEEGGEESKSSQHRRQLPWHDDTLTEFPFTTTCLLLGLLGDNGNATKRSRTRPGDIQLQPLSTVFLGDCIEYGLVVLDISDLDSGVKYGITAFPVRYMADVEYEDESSGWDPVEDPPPEKEPDVVPFSPRPRGLLSLHQWLSRYFHYNYLSNDPNFRRLDNMPVVDPAALDYIWPSERATYTEEGSTPRSSAEMVENTILEDPPRAMSLYRAKDDSTSRGSSFTMSDDSWQNILKDIDAVFDDMLVLTHEPAGPPLDRSTVGNLQMLAKFPKQLWQRLEEKPNRLGPFKVSSHVLAIAYAGHSHLNWVAFRNLTLSVITAAITSDELRGASALSICVDQFEMEREEGLKEFTAAVAQCTGLRQLCLLQRRDRDSDDASARFCSQLLLLSQRGASEERGGLEWLHDKTIYATCAFSTSLRSREFLTSSSTINLSSTFPHGQILPVMHMFMFGHSQSEDGPDVAADDVQPYRNYYTMNTTLLEAESFAVRFLAYLWSLGSGTDSEKAILQFAYNGASSSSSGQLGVIPIPAGFFDNRLPPNDPSRARLSDLHPGSWVVLVGSSDQSSDHTETLGDTPSGPCGLLPPYSPRKCHADTSQPSANMDRERRSSRSSDYSVIAQNAVFVHYSFVKIRQGFAEVDERHQQIPIPISNRAEVVGGLTDFLRETAPGSDIPAWEKRIGKMAMSLRTRRASIGIDIGIMAEIRARALLNQLL